MIYASQMTKLCIKLRKSLNRARFIGDDVRKENNSSFHIEKSLFLNNEIIYFKYASLIYLLFVSVFPTQIWQFD